MALVEYSLDKEGRMTVHNDTARWYRYIDMTPQAEALFRFIDRTIDAELVEELAFLANYDRAKKAVQEIVDMPDRQIDLFIRLCLQNNGRLSARKQARTFIFSRMRKLPAWNRQSSPPTGLIQPPPGRKKSQKSDTNLTHLGTSKAHPNARQHQHRFVVSCCQTRGCHPNVL